MAVSEKIISDFEHEVRKAHGEGWDYVDLSTEDAKEILELLKEQEAIVRCKDCIYLNEDSGICVIGIMHGYRDTWFCAYGKSR